MLRDFEFLGAGIGGPVFVQMSADVGPADPNPPDDLWLGGVDPL